MLNVQTFSLICMVAKICSYCFFRHNNTQQSSTAVSARKFRQYTGSVLKSTGELDSMRANLLKPSEDLSANLIKQP